MGVGKNRNLFNAWNPESTLRYANQRLELRIRTPYLYPVFFRFDPHTRLRARL